ncbi:phosphatase PAP2 family protein [Craurococcus roseus]|uniref:phosphatase PAP2 family protein n=1 Tax=Craurococcus roseus TaxID=77585 RepID=UPI0038D008ED
MDTALSRFDEAVGFDWVAWVSFVRSHPTLNSVLRTAYDSLVAQLLSSTIVFAALRVHGRNDELMLLACAAAILTTVMVALLPAPGRGSTSAKAPCSRRIPPTLRTPWPCATIWLELPPLRPDRRRSRGGLGGSLGVGLCRSPSDASDRRRPGAPGAARRRGEGPAGRGDRAARHDGLGRRPAARRPPASPSGGGGARPRGAWRRSGPTGAWRPRAAPASSGRRRAGPDASSAGRPWRPGSSAGPRKRPRDGRARKDARRARRRRRRPPPPVRGAQRRPSPPRLAHAPAARVHRPAASRPSRMSGLMRAAPAGAGQRASVKPLRGHRGRAGAERAATV